MTNRLVTHVKVAGRDVAVPEMTVADARNKLRERELGNNVEIDRENVWDYFINVDGMTLAEMREFSDFTESDMETATADELAALVKQIRAANTLFFNALDRWQSAVSFTKRVPPLPITPETGPTSNDSSPA